MHGSESQRPRFGPVGESESTFRFLAAAIYDLPGTGTGGTAGQPAGHGPGGARCHCAGGLAPAPGPSLNQSLTVCDYSTITMIIHNIMMIRKYFKLLIVC